MIPHTRQRVPAKNMITGSRHNQSEVPHSAARDMTNPKRFNALKGRDHGKTFHGSCAKHRDRSPMQTQRWVLYISAEITRVTTFSSSRHDQSKAPPCAQREIMNQSFQVYVQSAVTSPNTKMSALPQKATPC